MVFVDNLAFELFTLSLVSVIGLYLTVSRYSLYRKGIKEVESVMKPGTFILGLLGGIMLIMGF